MSRWPVNLASPLLRGAKGDSRHLPQTTCGKSPHPPFPKGGEQQWTP